MKRYQRLSLRYDFNKRTHGVTCQWAAAIPAAAALMGGIMGSNATEDAAQTQADAARDAARLNAQSSDKANANTMALYQQTRQDTQPYRDASGVALGQLTQGTQSGGEFNKPFSFGASDFHADPGYQFSLDQAQKALQRTASSNGTLNSGGFGKAMSDYTLGSANQEYGDVYNRAYNQFNTDSSNRFNRLATIAGLGNGANSLSAMAGQNSSNTMANTSANSAMAQSQAAYGAGNAQSAGIIGSNNAMVGGIGNAINQYTRNNALTSAYGQGGGGYDTGFNGQSNPANQQALNDAMSKYGD